MTPILLERRSLLRAGAAFGAAWLASPAVRACEFFVPTLRINHPWTRATAPGATTAALSMVFDEVQRTDRLIGAETPVATGCELGGVLASPRISFLIPAGQSTALSEMHTFVQLVGLQEPLHVGRTYPLRLIFEKGGAVEAAFDVDFEAA